MKRYWLSIVELLKKLKFKTIECPGVIVAGLGPFVGATLMIAL